ncbi:hypothetical protein DL93DRAFT_2069984 [Clavulina sp. PMI_390]|nr:hypothetical protein DL93DRAFT_2069984 [Clavulina sp. PMI_390]
MPKDSSSRSSRHRDSDRVTSLQNIDVISADDYFLKSDNFRLWLKESKGKYFDELSGEKARHYFGKFVKAWNRGELSDSIYNPSSAATHRASNLTGYKWSFASKLALEGGKSVDSRALEKAREDVEAATAGSSSGGTAAATSSRKPIGPMLPPGVGGGGRDDDDEDDDGPMPPPSSSSSSRPRDPMMSEADRQFEREARADRLVLSRASRHPRDNSEHEVFASGSKEKMMENKRARRDNDRSFREAKDADADGMGGYRDEDILGGGGGDSFRAAIARRDAARARADAKREGKRAERLGPAVSDASGGPMDRRQAMKDKDRQTMEMFKAMAKEKFGGS